MKPPMRFRRQRLDALAELMSDRIHYGCGNTILPGWLNVDGVDESYPGGRVEEAAAKRIFFLDLTRPHPFPDDHFRFGYAEDFLEHLDQAESLIFLCEAFRTLRAGGVLRLSFPSLAGVLRGHLRSSDFAGAQGCRQAAYSSFSHRHFYCFESIELVARHIGFADVCQCEYAKGRHPEVLHDSRPGQADSNLVVELTK